MKTVKVMIVEDSAPVRELLRAAISSDPGLEVVGVAASAERGLEMLSKVRPDVITMDIMLPGMNGLEATRKIMELQPTPIVVVSAKIRPRDNQSAMEALRAGALSVAETLPHPDSEEYPTLRKRLCDQLLAMSQVKVIRQLPTRQALKSKSPLCVGHFEAVGIVTSTGGPKAVLELLEAVGPSFQLPVLLVQHMTPGFLEGYVRWLDENSRQRVVLARPGDRLEEATVYVAPTGRHLRLQEGQLTLSDEDEVCFHKPSGDVLLSSMAQALGRHAIGVALTGMGRDGTDGLAKIQEAGGYTLSQEPTTAIASGMPAAAVESGVVKQALALPELGQRLAQLAAVRRSFS